jgi:hypothetical protein
MKNGPEGPCDNDELEGFYSAPGAPRHEEKLSANQYLRTAYLPMQKRMNRGGAV